MEFRPGMPNDAVESTRGPASPPASAEGRASPSPEFPGCRSFKLRRDEVEAYDRHIEYWDAATETAWELREVSGAHERPGHRLAGLCAIIAGVRGSGIVCFGHTSFVQHDDRGERLRLLEADESVYLYPERARMPLDSALTVGEHDLPDVILEVDNTTDVRRGKLALYESWGFPEVWVEVPEVQTPGRPRGLVRGLTICRLDGGRFRTAAESGAFPGWRASEIHAALNEVQVSARTGSALTRVGAGTRGSGRHPARRHAVASRAARGEPCRGTRARHGGGDRCHPRWSWLCLDRDRARRPQAVVGDGCGRDLRPPEVRRRDGLQGPTSPASLLSPAPAESASRAPSVVPAGGKPCSQGGLPQPLTRHWRTTAPRGVQREAG